MTDQRPRAAACVCVLLVALAPLWNSSTAADGTREPLHRRIDRILDSDRIGPGVAPVNDAEFLRRVSLDLTGMPPSADDLKVFLGDRSPDKRAKAVDRLLDSPLFARQWATTLDVMLMERRRSENVPQKDWDAYILDAARRDRPLNDIIGELLRADGVDPKNRAQARFYLDRESEPNGITRDVGRIFFGRDLQCAQCHNHPLVEDYRQSDYQGLLAFFSSSSEVTKKNGDKTTTSFPEKAGKDVAFDSVFVKDDHHLTGPRLPGGTELDEPVFTPGDEYQVNPARNVAPVPRHSRRGMLASLVTGGGNQPFNENLANRLWAMMMGRGLVHPVDLRHPGNPPSHPELLAMLGDELAATGFRVKPFLRELALSRVYQSAIDLPGQAPALPSSFPAELTRLKSQTAAREAAAERTQDEFRTAEKSWHKAESTLIPLSGEEQKAVARYVDITKKEEKARKAHADSAAALAAHRDTAKALAEAAGRSEAAVKKLPKEKELADAARVFTKRSAAATTELAALEKGIGAKAAALAKIGEERAAVARSIDAARARLRQVRESVRKQEAVVLAARRKKAEARTALENHQKRLAALDAYGRWHGLRHRLDENRREIEALGPALADAGKQAAEEVLVVEIREDDASKAVTAQAAAAKVRADAEARLERQQQAAAKVDSAIAAIQAAEELVATDAKLSETAEQLRGRADAVRSALPELGARLESARIAERRAADIGQVAKRALETARAECRRHEEGVRAVQGRLTAVDARGEALGTELTEATDELTSLLGNRFALAQLKPLTPEQIYWSMVKVTGVYDRTRVAEEAALAKAKPVAAAGAGANGPAAVRARAVEVEQRTFDKLKGDVRSFVRIYGAGAGQPQDEFFASADQALFASNGGSINGWTAPAGGNVAQRMIAERDARKAAEDLYLTILSRPPAVEESADVVRMLSVPTAEKPAVVRELVWGLLTSVEFRFNH